jgi:hypothetical protein
LHNAATRSTATHVRTTANDFAYVKYVQSNWQYPWVLTHEFGHSLYGCGDEYDEPSPDITYSQCSYSLMSDNPVGITTQVTTLFDEGDGLVHNICFSSNHATDPDPNRSKNTTLPSCMDQAANKKLIPFSWAFPTDNHSTLNFDFNYAIANFRLITP